MSGSDIQAQVYAGYAIAAEVLGWPHEVYRPSDPLRPLRLIDRLGTYRAVFDTAPNLKFAAPARAGNPIRFGLIDGAAVRSGDVAVGPAGTLFVADMPALQPIVCVLCNTTLSMSRPASAAWGFGAVRPPGVLDEIPVLADWPASVLLRGRAGSDDAAVPGDANPGSYEALMPFVPCMDPPRSGDTVSDRDGRRYAVDARDDTALGWRLLLRLLQVE